MIVDINQQRIRWKKGSNLRSPTLELTIEIQSTNYFIAKLSSLLCLYNSNAKSVREIVNGRQMWANDLDQKS